MDEGFERKRARLRELMTQTPAMSMRSIGRAVAAVALAVALAPGSGCATSKPRIVDFSDTPREYQSNDYHDAYERWTRHETVIHEVDPALEIWATFKTWDFRDAFVAHYATAYFLSQEDRNHLQQAQHDAAASGYEFFVTAQSSNYRWNDLEKKSSPWRIALVDGLGHELSPESIRVEKLPDMFEREFFPAKTPFTRTYTVRFNRPGVPSADGARTGANAGGVTGAVAGVDGVDTTRPSDFVGEKTGMIMLRVTGPFGHADLIWLGQ